MNVGFDSEEQLVKEIVACVRRARRREYRIEPELDAGVGIADLVLAHRAARTTKALHALASLPPRLGVLLSREIGGTIKSRESLAACIGTSARGTQRVIAQMAAVGLAKLNPYGLSISTVPKAPYARIIAVEAKISEWQRVLVQAYRNLQFADESWVVLDHAYVRPALAQIGRFQASGVGLASIDRTRGLFIHLAAKSIGPMSIGKRWQAQSVLAARVLSRRSPSESL